MAYFESLKFTDQNGEEHYYKCPSCGDELIKFPRERKNPFVKEVTSLLGPSTIWAMVAYHPMYCPDNRAWTYITDVLLGGDGKLALRLAYALYEAIPEGEVRLIEVRDASSASSFKSLAGGGIYLDTVERACGFFQNGKVNKKRPLLVKDDRHIFYDDRYAVVMEDHRAVDRGCDCQITLTIYAFPKED